MSHASISRSRSLAISSPNASRSAPRRLAHPPQAPKSGTHSRLEGSRRYSEGGQRNRRADGKCGHDEGYPVEMLFLGGQNGCCAERRPDARNPHEPEQRAQNCLAAEAPVFQAVGPLVGPGTERAGNETQPQLGRGHQKHRADQGEQRAAYAPEKIAVETDRKTDGGNEQADDREARGETGRECDRSKGMPALSRSEDDRNQGQDARGQDRENARQKSEHRAQGIDHGSVQRRVGAHQGRCRETDGD